MKHIKSFIFFGLFISLSAFAAAEKAGSNKATYLVSGDARLLSHFIDRGLSITDQNPALNSSFMFNFGQQFRLGFWGSNISNVTAQDDNLWLKIVAEIKIELSAATKIDFYIHDDHFYKPSTRNGQSLGFTGDYLTYFYQFEFMNNYQGSKTNAQYIKGGRKFIVATNTIASGSVGYTLQSADGFSNYFDFKAVIEYQVNSAMSLEAGTTSTFGASGLNGRGKPYFYTGLKLNF